MKVIRRVIVHIPVPSPLDIAAISAIFHQMRSCGSRYVMPITKITSEHMKLTVSTYKAELTFTFVQMGLG